MLRSLPSIDGILDSPWAQELLESHPRAAVLRAARVAVSEARMRILRGEEARPVDRQALEGALAREEAMGLRRVINATGVVLHTNLGRAPLAKEALQAIASTSGGYANLEFDLKTGRRGRRHEGIASLLQDICGAEAALAVNNNAGAVLLVLDALARGRECVVSRGELVEIGGGFRVPDVMKQAGIRLVEVGTTNRTRLLDYEEGMGEDTALLLKVFPSNFSIVGFHEEASVVELSSLAKRRGIPLFVDLGSGALRKVPGLPRESTVQEVLAAGADVVSFSGDKLLGGTQAGFIVGRRSLLTRMERHPLLRALRMDKMSIAASEATLRLIRDGREGDIPTMAMLTEELESVERRAATLSRMLEERGVTTTLRRTTAAVGGGAAPDAELPSVAVAVLGDAQALQRELRIGSPPVIARVEDDKLLLDMRTIADEEVAEVAQAIVAATRNVEGVLV